MAGIPESIQAKIKRANQHIADTNCAINSFWERRPYHVVAYIDSERRPTYQLKRINPVDPIISAIAGDAIQNIRTALDYLACDLWRRANSGDCKIYFPIADSASKYKTEALGKATGIGQDAIDAITAIEPFQGGKGEALWRLHRLNIIDKHRLPIAVVGGNLGIHIPSLYPEMFPTPMQTNPWIISTNDFKVPLKDADILFRDEPGRDVMKNLQLPLFVALNEAGIIEGKPLVPTLKEMLDVTNVAIASLVLLL